MPEVTAVERPMHSFVLTLIGYAAVIVVVAIILTIYLVWSLLDDWTTETREKDQ